MATHSSVGESQGWGSLENPRDGEAWWAAVYGVAQSWTQLKHPLRRRRGQGPHLAKRWEPRVFSRVAVGFSSFDGYPLATRMET